MQLQFFESAQAFLAEGRDWLGLEPVTNSLMATVAERAVRQTVPTGRPYWWLLVRGDAGEVVGAGMRCAPTPPYPIYLAAMPTGAAAQLADVLHSRGEDVVAVNGNSAAAAEFAERMGSHLDMSPDVVMHLRQFEAREVFVPRAPAGQLRLADAADLDLLVEWHEAFALDVDTQAGRPPQAFHLLPTRDQVLADIEAGRFWLWIDDDGTPAHFAVFSAPVFGVQKVGPVYTPLEHRRRGLASHVVAVLSEQALADGHRVCLYTDQANPTSNAIYQALGYRPLEDSVQIVLRRRAD